MKKTFTVTLEDTKEVLEYAKSKGFRSVSDLARFTISHYMTRYPLKSLRASQLQGSEGKSQEGTTGQLEQ